MLCCSWFEEEMEEDDVILGPSKLFERSFRIQDGSKSHDPRKYGVRGVIFEEIKKLNHGSKQNLPKMMI